jgi:hypothetical protein
MLGQGKRLPVATLGPQAKASVLPVKTPAAALCRAYDIDGAFLAVGRLDLASGCWQPEKVFVH